jgi:hypothetical protein
MARAVQHVLTSLLAAAWYRCAALGATASSPTILPPPRRGLEAAGGHPADGHGDVQLTGDMLKVVVHAGRRDLRAQVDADGLAREDLHPPAACLVEHRLHARPAAHPAGFVQGASSNWMGDESSAIGCLACCVGVQAKNRH